jgi:tetratricopeptide (TPR) repeat protein
MLIFGAPALDQEKHSHSALAGVSGNTENLGEVRFEVACKPEARRPFDRAAALLHSFEYDEARAAFRKIADKTPSCAMAYWGVAMSYVHPLWAPPSADEYKAGRAAAERAKRAHTTAARERGFIEAAGEYYSPSWEGQPAQRLSAYSQSMGKLYAAFPQDVEVAAFYALSLIATADPNDKTFSNQLAAGKIMTPFVDSAPKHPGLTHYIIHGYDNFELAPLALDAARKYAVIAPSSAHALHMPSHIFERLGLWKESAEMNIRSTRAARDYAEKAHMQGHWDEELHGLDFLLTAYLQMGRYDLARDIRDYIVSIDTVFPQNFKVAFVFAAAPARYALERKDWESAAKLPLEHANFPWSEFPWEQSVHTFAVGYARARLSDIAGAKACREQLLDVARKLAAEDLSYKAQRLEIYAQTIDAWIQLAGKDADGAILTMKAVVDRESSMIIPDGAILPATEILGDLYLALSQYENAIAAYDSARQKRRRGAITGALQAAVALKDATRVARYQALLADISNGAQQWQASVP